MEKNKLSNRGRPLKESSLSEVLPPVRVTLEQKNAYRKAADSSGMSLSAWLKNAADEMLISQLDFEGKND